MARQPFVISGGITRRGFLLGAGAGTLALALSCLREGDRPASGAAPAPDTKRVPRLRSYDRQVDLFMNDKILQF